MIRGRVRITDLASELGVSPSTVSRALSNEGRIGEKTRKAVLELADKWGYKPNPFAVNLLKKRSKSIGLILPEFTHHYFSKVLCGVNRVINEHGYHLFINTHDDSFEKEVKAVNMLNSMRVDGIIASYTKETSSFDHFLDTLEDNIPVVFVDRMCEELDTSYVVTDDFPQCVEAVQHMVRTGSQKIAYITGPENLSTSFTRLMGYREGLRQCGIPQEDRFVLNSDHAGWEKKLETLILSNEIDGLLAFNDYLAFQAVELFKKHGKNIPDEVAVIGFADEPVASYMSPRLSTIMQPAELMGQRAVEILLWHIENPASPMTQCESLPTSLVLRETTRKVGAERRPKSKMRVLKSAS